MNINPGASNIFINYVETLNLEPNEFGLEVTETAELGNTKLVSDQWDVIFENLSTKLQHLDLTGNNFHDIDLSKLPDTIFLLSVIEKFIKKK